MVVYIEAYLDIEQEEIEEYISKNGKDINKQEDKEEILQFFYKKITGEDLGEKHYGIYYQYNKKLNLHEIIHYHTANFIYKNEKFANLRYISILEKKIGKKYPDCLHMPYMVYDKKNALDIAEGLRIFFSEDDDLISYAEWLKKTAKYCSFYEFDR